MSSLLLLPQPTQTLPLTRSSVLSAHAAIKPHIHLTPVLTNTTLDRLASTPQSASDLAETKWTGQHPAHPRIRFYFKCENFQRIGAFKARGAFHALSRLSAEEVRNGVITNSSGNHAQALALAARERGVPAYIVMPTISTPSKIAATKAYGANVVFSGSTSEERAAVMEEVQERTGACYVPPYDHPHVMLGQGTMALELEEQAKGMLLERRSAARAGDALRSSPQPSTTSTTTDSRLHAVIAPLGGGGMLSGIATALSGTGTLLFGAEPSFSGADDGARGLAVSPPQRVVSVDSLTIADGLRTPVGELPWTVISNKEKVRGVYSVTEEQILRAMRLVLERMKVVIEPSAAVGLAVALFNEDFRGLVEREGGAGGWDLGVVFSGGNTTVEAMMGLFGGSTDGGKGEAQESKREIERAEGKVGIDGSRIAENVLG